MTFKLTWFNLKIMILTSHKKAAKDDKHVNVPSGTIKRDENMPLSHTCYTQNKIISCMFPWFKAFVLTDYLIQNGLRRKRAE